MPFDTSSEGRGRLLCRDRRLKPGWVRLRLASLRQTFFAKRAPGHAVDLGRYFPLCETDVGWCHRPDVLPCLHDPLPPMLPILLLSLFRNFAGCEGRHWALDPRPNRLANEYFPRQVWRDRGTIFAAGLDMKAHALRLGGPTSGPHYRFWSGSSDATTNLRLLPHQRPQTTA